MIEVLSSGAANLIQDLGRRGYLDNGLSRGGAMDSLALSVANAMVGNDAREAGIEVSMFPFKIRSTEDIDFAVAGADCVVRVEDEIVAPWWGRAAKAGQTIVIERPRRGARAYLAVGGGIDVEMIMGSRSTDLKANFGGVQGRGLKRGDQLGACEPYGKPRRQAAGLGVVPRDLPAFWQALSAGEVTVRVLEGAEYALFDSSARTAFAQSAYEITADANRVGYRLSGAPLGLAAPVELLSHGIVPGTVQVPPSGQPIIQLAEANTCGGYPKIATVIEADLWKLAQAPVGCRIRFESVDIDTAVCALQEQAEELGRIRSALALMAHRA